MRKIYLLSFLIVMGISYSCTDLEVEPKSTTTSTLVFDDPASYRSFIARVYAGYAISGQQGPAGDPDIKGIDEGFSNYIRQYWIAQELPTDEAVIAWSDEGLPAMNSQTWTPANQFVTALYNRVFYQVSIANEFLKETTESKLNERAVTDELRAEIRAYRAEARFVRALSYWHGIDLYGDIPFFLEDKTIGKEAPDQDSRENIFNFVEQELIDIEEDMIAPGQNEYGRADRAALWMLQAKLYLNAEVYTGSAKYSECIEACKKIISSSYTLTEEYQANFMADNHNSSEIIFAIPFDGERTQSWGGMTFLVHATIGGDMEGADYGVNNGWGGIRTTSKLVNLFPDETGELDSRAIFFTEGQSKEINDVSLFTEGYAMPKFTNVASDGTPGADLDFPDTDFPMFRLADAYLMYAEAVLRGGSGGDMGTAVDYINEIRERAYGDQSGNINSGQLTLEFILDERARELYWEAHRRTDLIRFDQFSDNGIWPFKGGVKEGKTTEPFRDLFPIPASEIIANPKLEQNTGY